MRGQSNFIPLGWEWLKDVFTEKELNSLLICYDDIDGVFLGIGFIGPEGKMTQFAEPTKAEAIKILEKEVRDELQKQVT